jgi:hypothetical protein
MVNTLFIQWEWGLFFTASQKKATSVRFTISEIIISNYIRIIFELGNFKLSIMKNISRYHLNMFNSIIVAQMRLWSVATKRSTREDDLQWSSSFSGKMMSVDVMR